LAILTRSAETLWAILRQQMFEMQRIFLGYQVLLGYVLQILVGFSPSVPFDGRHARPGISLEKMRQPRSIVCLVRAVGD
jgi:hypothetical protein